MQAKPNGTHEPRIRTMLLVLVPIAAILALRIGELPVGAVSDDAYYVETARSLAEGKGPVIDHGPPGRPASAPPFPAGFPLLLSPLAGLFPDSLDIHKTIPVLALLGIVWFCAGTRIFGPLSSKRRIAVAVLVGINPWVVAAATRVVSELPFTLWVLLAGTLYVRWRTEGSLRMIARVGLVTATVMAVMTRTVGIALLAAMALDLILDRKWKGLAAWLGPVILVWTVPIWMGWPEGRTAALGRYADQVFTQPDGWSGRVQLALGNLTGYLEETARVLVPGFPAPETGVGPTWVMTLVALVLGGALLVAVAGRLAGIASAGQKEGPVPRARFWASFVILYFLALLSFRGYPSGVQPRLLVPLVPLMIGWLAGWTEGRSRRLGWAAFGVIALVAIGHNAWRVARPLGASSAAAGHGFVDPSRGADWVRDHLPDDAVIAVRDPIERHLYFRRSTVPLEPDQFHLAEWIFLGPGLHEGPGRLPDADVALFDSLAAAPDRFPVVHRDTLESITVFSVGPRPTDDAPVPADRPPGEPSR